MPEHDVKDHEYITCRELIDFLMDYVDGTLLAAQRAEFDRHLAVCPSCVAYVESYRQTVRLGKASMIGDDKPADAVAPRRLVDAVRQARRLQSNTRE